MFFLILPSDLESVLNSAFLGTHIDLFEEKSVKLYLKKNIRQSILLYSMVLSRWGRRSTYMRRDAREEGGCDFSSKMPRIMSNLPDFPRRPFLYAHLCVYTKSMETTVKSGNVGNGVWFGNGTSIHIIPTGYLIN